ncbi:hypothetical protein EW145_g1158 [Phellinidium pouzarii]|uniref:Tyrosine specific protein phosphatases domain-containing protein n=1 Tax=Phellinidium pouzarii TaxID=167371 RepID=A0A4S4LG74_9AGAM|nr:hypothetical protein EW145_g1158 [Phellinidium pouzarii]
MVSVLGALDADLVQRILNSPPFHSVDGVINFRDLGSSSGAITPGILFRSGELTRLSQRGKDELKALGVATVFDLRSQSEITKYSSATPEIDGVRFVHVPVSDKDEYDPMALAARVTRFETDEKEAFATLYSNILESGARAYETILKHIRDKPGEACLVHCTAGKDRTGMFAAIVQLLLGATDDAVIQDYYLTTFGLQPALPHLVARFQREALYQKNKAGFEIMASAKKETMHASLEMIRTKYGGAEAYIKQCTTLTDADIAQIRKNLAADPVAKY